MAGISVLIIDDEHFMRRIVRQTLTTLGYEHITEAESAVTALNLFGKKKFDLILSDIYMPNMSGLELLKAIRSCRTNAPGDSRVIFLTSFSNTEILKTSIDLDVNGFMVKPIKSDMMRKKILQALNENMSLKDEHIYQLIDIDPQWTSHIKKQKVISIGDNKSVHTKDDEPAQEMAAEADAKIPEDVMQVAVLQIKPDSVLAEDLVAKDGMLLLSAGQKLNQQMINRLHDLHTILSSDFIKIKIPD